MKRREFIALIGGAAAARPLVARAQPAMPVIGFLTAGSPETSANLVAAFRNGLAETGHVEGRNVAIEYRWGRGQYEHLPALAAELVSRQVAVIVTSGSAVGLAAKAATTTTPIVFNVSDPIRLGLVATLNRPGGNATGVNLFTADLGPKRLGLLRELMPKAASIGLLVNPGNPTSTIQIRDLQAAAPAAGMDVQTFEAADQGEFEAVFAAIVQRRVDALVVGADPLFNNGRDQLVALAARYAVPAVYQWREFAEAGGLISYGESLKAAFQQMGIYAGRILKGAKPGDLPVVQPTKFELVINLKTAKALGLEVPTSIQLLADEVIE